MKSVDVYLLHMVDCMLKVAEYIECGEEEFSKRPMIQDAVIRNLEVIGEAAKRVPETTRETYPSIPWKRLAGLRDVLIHQYEGVDIGQVWRIAYSTLPAILVELQAVLASTEEQLPN